jgi:hypothetical protein
MSKFPILRVDYYDPVKIGRKNRILYTIYGVLPTLFVISFNLGEYGTMNYHTRLMISLPLLALIYFLLLRKVRSDINNMQTIGELEITQSGIKKRLGDSTEEFSFGKMRNLTLTKHMPATRVRESKSGYFSYILNIEMTDGLNESLVISDRSLDHNHKLSILETMKTLKKIVPIEVKILI